MKITLLALIFTFTVAADDCINCSPDLNVNAKLADTLTTLTNITAVSCTDVLEAEADAEYKENFSKSPIKSEVINGKKFLGSAEELSIVKKMLGQKPTAEWSKVGACESVLCALTNLYNSKEAAQRSLNLAKKAGYIFSLQKDFNLAEIGMSGQLFKKEEIQNIDLAFKNLPASFRKLKSLTRLKRMPDGYASSDGSSRTAAYAIPGYGSISEGEITFLEKSFSSDGTWSPRVAVHELVHHLDFGKVTGKQFGFSESPEFLKLSGWSKSQEYVNDPKTGNKVLQVKWSHTPEKKFVREYAASSPAEDFAESAAYYVYEPQKFKKLDPEKYDFIKNKLFGGKEYNNEIEINLSPEEMFATCMNNTTVIYLWKEEFTPEISSSCLNSQFKDYKYTDTRACKYNKDQIKEAYLDRISPLLSQASEQLQVCNSNLSAHTTACVSEKNFQQRCAIEKCNLDKNLEAKVKEAKQDNLSSLIIDSLVEKLGKNKFLATTLASGLNGIYSVNPANP